MALSVRNSLMAWGALLALLGSLPVAAHAQAGSVSGVVVDETSNPIANARVVVAGTDLQAVTDARGEFRLENVPGSQADLQVTIIGFRPVNQSVRVGTDDLRVIMRAAAVSLDEIVVTGTAGGQELRSIGNVVGTVDAAAVLATMAPPNVEQILGGRSAGVVALATSGQLGAGAPIRIRGTTSMSLANEPIVFIDGVRMDSDPRSGPGGQRGGAGVSRLNDLNPDDIQSVEIIKGPSAATLYGTEASNGVIQIITKRGAAGRPQLDLSIRRGTNWMMNPEGRAGLLWWPNTSTGELQSINLYEYERDFGTGPIFQNGTLQGYNANLRGGNDAVRYFVSGGYDHDVGIVDFNWDKRLTARVNLDLTLLDNLTARLSSGYIRRSTSLMQTGFSQDPFSNLIWGNPRTLDNPANPLKGWFRAPPSEWGKIENVGNNDRSTTSLELRYKPFPWFSHRLATGLDVNAENNSLLYPRQPEGGDHVWGADALGRKEVEQVNRRNISVDYSASAEYRPLTQDLALTSTVGFQYYKRERGETVAEGRIFPALPITTVSGGSVRTASEQFEENATVGGFFQQQFDWRNRIFLTGAIRADDNSAFGAEYDAAIYPKLSGTWVLHEEPFWPLAWVNQLKLRGAWGVAGQQPGTFDASRLYSPEVGFQNEPSLIPDAFGNPQLKPERSSELEFGFDASLWNGKIELNFTRYERWVNDAIVERPVPPSTGFSGDQIVNLGKVRGWGNELGIIARVIESPRFGWEVGAQFATMGNRIDDLGGIDVIGAGGRHEHRPGYPVGGLFIKQIISAEIDAGGFVTQALCDGGTGATGLDQGGPAVDCDDAPRVYWGPGTPTWQLGFNSTFTLFRDLRLDFRFEGNGGHYNINTEMRATHNLGLSEKVLRRDDPLVQATRAIENDVMGLYDASFIRLRELGMTYTLPRAIVSRFGASRGSFSLTGRNLMMLWTGAHGFGTPRDGRVRQVRNLGNLWTWDPEIRSSGQVSATYQTVLPPTASVQAVLRLGF